jgi:hypothetical protein
VDMLAAFLAPDFGTAIHGYVTLPSAIAELSMVGYLLVVGVKPAKPDELTSAPVAPLSRSLRQAARG